MRHAAHKAAKVSNERFSVAKALFTSSRGSHT
ncbi:MAG: CHAP domain-containing protein, partial [Bifidobacterium sp.]